LKNTNFIASAGTGKTYNLVEQVIDKIKNENLEIKDLLILTFTEKAGTELKERIRDRFKKELRDTKSPKIHKQLLELENGYIGTFHSVFLRFLKKHPEITQIDKETQIISSTLDTFLDTQFEKWTEIDFNENKEDWKEIIKISSNSQEIKGIFKEIYKNRLKFRQDYKEFDLKTHEKSIKTLKENLEKLINQLFEEYEEILEKIKNQFEGKGFRNSPYIIREILKKGDFANLPYAEPKGIGEGKTSFIFKSPNNKKIKEFLKNEVIPLFDEGLEILDKDIETTVKKLKEIALDYNAKIVLNKYFQFHKFIEQTKKEQNIIDFNDILKKTSDLLSENPEAREKIKKRFRYIFIDEFQDTDEIQLQIIKQISDDNLIVFGDPKQCIYEWRDANLDSYFEFLEKNSFKDIVLSQNFRSSPELIQLFNHLFTRDTLLTHIDKKFRQPIECGDLERFKDSNSFIKLIDIDFDTKKYKAEEAEAIETIKIIKELIEDGNEFKDIMILFRQNNHLNHFKNIFQKYNIPVKTSSNENLFQQPEIQNIINILKFLEFPQDQSLLLKLLKSPLKFITEEELYKDRGKINFETFKESLFVINQLINEKINLTVEQIINEIYNKTYLQEVYSLYPDGEQKLLNLQKFKTIAQKLSQENYSLRDFLLYVETGEEETAENKSSENVVELLTMHKAKGLQRKIIILPMTNRTPNPQKKAFTVVNGKIYLNFSKAQSLGIDTIKEKLDQSQKNEEERLLYVALTRAEEKLIITSSKRSKNLKDSYKELLGKGLEGFNEEFLIEEKVKFENEKIDPINLDQEAEKEKIESIEEKLTEIKELENWLEEENKKAFQTQKFVSVSQLMEEEKEENPVIFINKKDKEENIALYVGILVHEVLEDLDFKNYSIEKVKQIIEKKSNKIPETMRKKVVKESLEILKRFENSPLHKELKEAQIIFKELPFTYFENGKFIEGRIDIIYKKGDTLIVMDYKTNRYETKDQKKKLIEIYEKQKEYYTKAVKRIFPEEKITFKLGLLWKGEIL